MTDAFEEQGWTWAGRALARSNAALTKAAKAAGPPLLFGLRLWASVCLALYIAFWLELDNEYWAGLSAAIVCQPQLGASLRKGWYRMIGTIIGAVAIVVLTALFPQARAPFLVALALWAACCALVGTLLHNFAAYSAVLAGYTAVIVAGDELGATGGPNANAVFLLAVTRATETCIGIVSAGVVLAATDFGGARRRLAGSFAALSAEIVGRFTNMLSLAGPEMPETQPVRRELIRRAIALDPLIDSVKGESSQLRYHSPVLQNAVDGLFSAIVGWRIVAVLLARLPDSEAQEEANAVLRTIPRELRAAEHGVPAEWLADPARVRDACGTAARTLAALPAATPALRLLADQTARLLDGISAALNGLARLATAFALLSPPGRGNVQIRVPDWLPALVNAGRAFVVICIVELFWIVTEWPNGALAITFAAIAVLLLALQANRAYAAALGFTIGILLSASLTAIIAFAVLPGLETFEAFCLAIALYLIPAGALMATGVLMALPRLTVPSGALILGFVPLLAPANVMNYDPQQYYNAALAIVSGSSTAAISFVLLPPLSPAFRTRRLLALTLRDLRRLATGRVSWTAGEWESRIFGRLAVFPDSAEPLQRSQLVAALLAGSEIVQLRGIASVLGVGAELSGALNALAPGNSALAAARLARLDERLAALSGTGPEASLACEARGSIFAISAALNDYAAYFDAGEPI
jgi:uncharacterized membrane protein YccC